MKKFAQSFPLHYFWQKNLQDFILKLFPRQNIHYHIKQKFSNLPNIASWSKVTTIEILLEMLYIACSCKRQHEKLSLEFGQTFDFKFLCLFSRGQTVFNFYFSYCPIMKVNCPWFSWILMEMWIVFHAAFQNTLTINFLRFVAVSQENYYGAKTFSKLVSCSREFVPHDLASTSICSFTNVQDNSVWV